MNNETTREKCGNPDCKKGRVGRGGNPLSGPWRYESKICPTCLGTGFMVADSAGYFDEVSQVQNLEEIVGENLTKELKNLESQAPSKKETIVILGEDCPSCGHLVYGYKCKHCGRILVPQPTLEAQSSHGVIKEQSPVSIDRSVAGSNPAASTLPSHVWIEPNTLNCWEDQCVNKDLIELKSIRVRLIPEPTLEAQAPSNSDVDLDPACPACFHHNSNHTNPIILPIHFKCKFCGTTWANNQYKSDGSPAAASTVSLIDALRQTAHIQGSKYLRFRKMYEWAFGQYVRSLNALYGCEQWVPLSETVMRDEIAYFRSDAATFLPEETQEIDASPVSASNVSEKKGDEKMEYDILKPIIVPGSSGIEGQGHPMNAASSTLAAIPHKRMLCLSCNGYFTSENPPKNCPRCYAGAGTWVVDAKNAPDSLKTSPNMEGKTLGQVALEFYIRPSNHGNPNFLEKEGWKCSCQVMHPTGTFCSQCRDLAPGILENDGEENISSGVSSEMSDNNIVATHPKSEGNPNELDIIYKSTAYSKSIELDNAYQNVTPYIDHKEQDHKAGLQAVVDHVVRPYDEALTSMHQRWAAKVVELAQSNQQLDVAQACADKIKELISKAQSKLDITDKSQSEVWDILELVLAEFEKGEKP